MLIQTANGPPAFPKNVPGVDTVSHLQIARWPALAHLVGQLQWKSRFSSSWSLAEQAIQLLCLYPNKNKIPNVVFLFMPLMLGKIYFVMKMEEENLTRALCALHVSTGTQIGHNLSKLAFECNMFFLFTR